LPTHRFDFVRFGEEVEEYRTRKGKLRADIARAAGVSTSTIGNAVTGRPVSIDVAISICHATGKVITDYIVEGLPTGINERWRATHTDGRTVVVERTSLSARFVLRNRIGNISGRGNRRYGNGVPGYQEFVKKFLDEGFTETEHITA
jgi:transcriptional regulator with XRE-family HTH domain